MAKLNDLEDVTISNPKAGDVVKYTSTGWVNGADVTGTPPGGNPCGDMDGIPNTGSEETITEKWTWENAGCPSIEVKDTEAGHSSYICPNKFQVQGDNVTGVLGLDSGDIRMVASGGKLKFTDSEVTTPVTLAELVACCDDGGGGEGFVVMTLGVVVAAAAAVVVVAVVSVGGVDGFISSCLSLDKLLISVLLVS